MGLPPAGPTFVGTDNKANALIASELAALEARRNAADDSKQEHRIHSAEMARSQLKMLKLKTRVAEEEVIEEAAGEEGGEEGAEDGGGGE